MPAMGKHSATARKAPQALRTRAGSRSAAKPARRAAPAAAVSTIHLFDFPRVYQASGMERISVIRHGVSARDVGEMAARMKTSQDELIRRLGLKRTTVARKSQSASKLSSEQSERMVGLSKLIGQVQTIVEQSGEPKGFDAAEWLEHWLSHPNPSLGGALPADFLDTIEGQELLGTLIAQMQSGAYA
ncbi:hypothetical protein LMG28688_05875 [Paraburkholderia caffeinitolerans]|uniref:Uncharacterized protein n=1 Tax=Paraburkholderia caffeinitolerans TaxID=1723730 RepID=A0A6J5GMW7_9BURK|nr:antitoxin Xre-like helix-turn-helix domain-containing protein [Paraburkholderia caffeinitolerans]CAB3803943.1 hypothetical protein LMG28688_05875 [Paraburkholderia caffeinitolerans]